MFVGILLYSYSFNIFPRSIHHNSGESLASSSGHGHTDGGEGDGPNDGGEGDGEFWEEGEGEECGESENEDNDDTIVEIEDG